MAVYELDNLRPQLHETAWVAEDAQVIGAVQLQANASVWFGAVVRGDVDRIAIGVNSNVQDGSVLHVDQGKPLRVGAGVTVGHMVMLHGCTIGNDCLIGIGAVVLNEAQIGDQCLVGAGSLITEGKVFPSGSLILGRPAKVVRSLTPLELQAIAGSARRYVDNAQRYRRSLRRVD